MKIPKGGVLSIPLMSGYASLHSMLAMGGAKKRRLPLRYAWRLLSEGTGNPKKTPNAMGKRVLFCTVAYSIECE